MGGTSRYSTMERPARAARSAGTAASDQRNDKRYGKKAQDGNTRHGPHLQTQISYANAIYIVITDKLPAVSDFIKTSCPP